MGDRRALARAAIVAALAVGLAACVTKRAAAPAPASTAVAATYADCAAAKDPPGCLIDRAISVRPAGDPLRSTIESGSVASVIRHRDLILIAWGVFEPVEGLSDKHSVAYLKQAPDGEFIAAAAAAAAAQIADDPLKHALVKPLITKAGSEETALLALIVWNDVVFIYGWHSDLTRPRGLSALFRAVVQRPPKDANLLIHLAERAEMTGATKDAVGVARIIVERPDVAEEVRDRARWLIDRVEADPPPSAYDAALVKEWLETCRGYDDCSYWLFQAADAGATDDLKVFGSDLTTRARREGAARQKTALYGAASEAFRLAGEIPAALAVAREGMRFVPVAVNKSEGGRLDVAARGEFSWEDERVAPAIALYRAGARDEALASGYLTGDMRYRHAGVAGETPDPAWAIEAGAAFPIRRLLDAMIAKRNTPHASRLYEALRCRGNDVYEDEDLYELDMRLAVLAALTGRLGSMREHLKRSAKALDRARVLGPLFAHYLAQDWRRAMVVAERVGAKDDIFTEASCAAKS